MDFTAITTPSVLGSASLIAFISVRSTSIADRIRNADREIVDHQTPPDRRRNLLAQVHGLRRRYIADTYAMIALLVAFIAFCTMDALVTTSRRAAVAAFAVGVITGGAGFVLSLYEVLTSPNTLFLDIAYAAAVSRDEAPASGGKVSARGDPD